MNFLLPYINAAIGFSPIGYSSVPLQRIHTQIFLYSHRRAVSLTEISGRCSCMLLPTPAIIFWYRQHYSSPTMYCLYFLIYFLMSLPTTQPLVIRESLIVHNQPVPSKLFVQKVSLYPPTSFWSFSRGEPFTPPALMHSSDTSYEKPITCLGILTFM